MQAGFGFTVFGVGQSPPPPPALPPMPSLESLVATMNPSDMGQLGFVQNQIAAQNAQLLNQISQMLATYRPSAAMYAGQYGGMYGGMPMGGGFCPPPVGGPMCPPPMGGIYGPNMGCAPPPPSLQGYVCPMPMPTPWQGMIPWGGGGFSPWPGPTPGPVPPSHGGHCPAPPAPGQRYTMDPAVMAKLPPRTQTFLEAALAKQGTQYIPGSCGPSGFDCSGLVWRSLKQAGVKSPRAAARYMQTDYASTAVTKEQLKPGDLLFFWSPNNRGIPYPKATHVEVYLGDGLAMGTDSTHEPARVEPVNWKTFVGGARVPELQS